MATLVTLGEVKLWIGVENADDDDLITDLISMVSNEVVRYTGRQFDDTSKVEYIDGGNVNLIVQAPPINTVTSILDTADDDSTVDSGLYSFDPAAGMIYLDDDSIAVLAVSSAGQAWGVGRRRWKVTYVPDYAGGTPEDIKLAVLTWIADSYANRDDLSSERLGDHAVTRAGAMPKRVELILNSYRTLAI